MRDRHVLEMVYGSPWAITEDKLRLVATVAQAHAAGALRIRAKEAVAEQERRSADRANVRDTGAIGVIRIHGTIFPRGSALLDTSGVATTESIGAQFDAMVQDERVSSIVLDIDSPGGMVYGVPELAEKIRTNRGTKPIVAHAWNEAFSAAYWIASAADEISVTPSGEVGSIGVLMVHAEFSKALENDGVKVNVLRAGKFKAELTSFEPLSDEARAYQMARLEDYHADFVGAVAKGRGVATSVVRESFGQGRVVGAEKAKELGMVDRIETFDQLVKRLSSSQGRGHVVRRRSSTLRALNAAGRVR